MLCAVRCGGFRAAVQGTGKNSPCLPFGAAPAHRPAVDDVEDDPRLRRDAPPDGHDDPHSGAVEELVVCVDDADRETGVAAKGVVHATGALHRAVSVVLADPAGRILLQRRAPSKYHCAGLWTNTCCGHPRPGERPVAAAGRRLRYEMGIECELWWAGRFTYRAELVNGLIEHEVDHVFVSRWQGEPVERPSEVGAWRWVPLGELRDELRAAPQAFTPWFAGVLDVACTHPMLQVARSTA